jgi:hypothetical protein
MVFVLKLTLVAPKSLKLITQNNANITLKMVISFLVLMEDVFLLVINVDLCILALEDKLDVLMVHADH